jgi:hypothetical protein
MLTILFSTCTRLLPRLNFNRAFNSPSHHNHTSGYHRVGANGNVVAGRGRPTTTAAASAEDEENRLIDQLDEEWDD